jgi:hypothetical protein
MQFKKRYINQESAKCIPRYFAKRIVIIAKFVAQATDVSSNSRLEQDAYVLENLLEDMSASVNSRRKNMIIDTEIQLLSNRLRQGNGIFN